MNLEHIKSVRVLATTRTNQAASAVMQTVGGCVNVAAATVWTVCVPIGLARLTFISFNGGPQHASPLVTGTFGVLPPGQSYYAKHIDRQAGLFIAYAFAPTPAPCTFGGAKGFYQDEALASVVALANDAYDRSGHAANVFSDNAIHDLNSTLNDALVRASSNLPEVSARVGNIVSAQMAEPLSVDQMARALGCSAGHLSRRFRIETGCSLWESVVAARIERAKLLLRYTDWPMTQIASVTGFFDQSHFSTTFRRSTSLSPGQYRRNGGHSPKQGAA